MCVVSLFYLFASICAACCVASGFSHSQRRFFSLSSSSCRNSLFAGENFLSDLTAEDKQRMLDMNIVQVDYRALPASWVEDVRKLGSKDSSPPYFLPPLDFVSDTPHRGVLCSACFRKQNAHALCFGSSLPVCCFHVFAQLFS